MKAYSQDLRDRVIAMHKQGYTAIKISQDFLIGYETAKSWIRLYKNTGDYSSRQHLNTGVKRKFTDKAAVLSYLFEHPNALATEIRDAVAPNLPISTFKDALVWMKISYKKRDCVYSKR
jgi:transposase